TTSGLVRFTTSTMPSPSSAVPTTSIPCCAYSRAAKPARIIAWSSTMSTRTSDPGSDEEGWATGEDRDSDTVYTYRTTTCFICDVHSAVRCAQPSIGPRVTSINRTARQTQGRTSQSSAVRRFGKNVWYLLAGFAITLISFPVLVIMTTVSVATLVVWLGALLLPLTLLFASSLAALSKRRLEALEVSVEPVAYRRYASGVFGKLRIISDRRRWLDLAFEGLLAFPLRLVTFALTLSWALIGLGGVTYFFWSIYLPGDRTVIQLLQLAEPALIPDGGVLQYLLDV